jgi:hypothetical protein
MAALLRVILARTCTTGTSVHSVAGLEAPRAALGPTPEYAAHRADVPVADSGRGASVRARPAQLATTGTGAEMSANGTSPSW